MKYNSLHWNNEIYVNDNVRFLTAKRYNRRINFRNKNFTSSPRSSAVRSSTIPQITFHRQSISAKYPRQIGAAALNANLKRTTHDFTEEIRNLQLR